MSEKQLTLIAAVDDMLRYTSAPRIDGRTEPLADTHRDAWIALYQDAYVPHYSFSPQEAAAEWNATIAGEYGQLWNAASPQFVVNGALAGSILTVHQAPWDDVPPGPFVIELIVAAPFRRYGIAGWLLRRAAEACRDAGQATLALRVMDYNATARSLYARLGFREAILDAKAQRRKGN